MNFKTTKPSHAATFYSALIQQRAGELAYALERQRFAAEHETGAAFVRWTFRVESARKAFQVAIKATTIDAIGVEVKAAS